VLFNDTNIVGGVYLMDWEVSLAVGRGDMHFFICAIKILLGLLFFNLMKAFVFFNVRLILLCNLEYHLLDSRKLKRVSMVVQKEYYITS